MILAVSTSCTIASAAYIDEEGKAIVCFSADAPRRASEVVLSWLDEVEKAGGPKASDAKGFVADVGPGSFTGVKVATTIVKTFGYAFGKPVAGVSSFDLISLTETVVVPNVAGRHFVRRQGEEPIMIEGLPEGSFVGYGKAIDTPIYPEAVRSASVVDTLVWIEPERLVPLYIAEPSISIPKKAYGSLVQSPEGR